MPIFGSKFTPKKTPARKNASATANAEPQEELVGENRTVKLNLGGQEQYFENGVWISGEAG